MNQFVEQIVTSWHCRRALQQDRNNQHTTTQPSNKFHSSCDLPVIGTQPFRTGSCDDVLAFKPFSALCRRKADVGRGRNACVGPGFVGGGRTIILGSGLTR